MKLVVHDLGGAEFPETCVVCGDDSPEWIATSCTTGEDLGGVPGVVTTFKERTSQIQYPLCAKHKRTTWLFRQCGRRSLGAFVVLAVAWIWLLLGGLMYYSALTALRPANVPAATDDVPFLWAVAAPLILLLFRFASKRLSPVILECVDQHGTALLRINDRGYAKALREANPTRIHP